jgi:hypothetical protein
MVQNYEEGCKAYGTLEVEAHKANKTKLVKEAENIKK